MPAEVPRFSEEEFEALDQWLLRLPAGFPDVVTLDGFLTAIVIGPNTVLPSAWLPKVWGSKSPPFKTPEEFNRFLGLVLGYYNDLVQCLAAAPEEFEPTFYENTVRGRTVTIVDDWCEGFVKGMRLDPAPWKVLKRDRPDLLKPITLFGTRAGWRELEVGGEAAMHRIWSVRIAPAVREIYAFWLPVRRATATPATPGRSH